MISEGLWAMSSELIAIKIYGAFVPILSSSVAALAWILPV
jgi:hypothetical protein